MEATFVKIEEIDKFVNFVSKLKGKVYLKSGEIKVNAKSIIGAIYLVREHPYNIVVEVEDPKEKGLVLDFLMQGFNLKKD
ncbi:MAG: HPr family phosphocarrier protein [Clostridia bacterium]|nr:HPr family phosphocarrier protein [Clostridia bacterium]